VYLVFHPVYWCRRRHASFTVRPWLAGYNHDFRPAACSTTGIQTGADLRAKSLAFLQQHFGKSAAWYLGIANGEDDRPVVADRPRKSSGSETTFERDLTASAEIEAGVEAMADDVWAWCEKAKAFGRTVTVK
jgi:DNA polymerase-4